MPVDRRPAGATAAGVAVPGAWEWLVAREEAEFRVWVDSVHVGRYPRQFFLDAIAAGRPVVVPAGQVPARFGGLGRPAAAGDRGWWDRQHDALEIHPDGRVVAGAVDPLAEYRDL